MAAHIAHTPKLEHKGYNRGLILGLTMAESMLLLVFCLLLVSAALVTAERKKRYEAERELRVTEQKLAELKKDNFDATARVVELQARLGAGNLSPIDREKFEKEWRELISARQAVDRLHKSGVEMTELEKLAALRKVLNDNGIDLDAAPAEIKRLVSAKTAAKSTHEWPPIINLSEAGGYYFRSGSAELTNEFQQKLSTSISNQIADNLSRYQVDLIEVIGHTDEQPLARTGSNLDKTFIDVLDNKLPITSLEPADNAGLGLARAIAVANILKANPKLRQATVLPMSAAQLILPGDTVTAGQAGNVEARRRIEIRIRRRAQSLSP
ncbi:OmpA family protein [Rhizobium leguminosarum]|uniref:OmpA family protein n=1 Tax=Rhizobium leguminosarum TaxID=384 RepID=UPI001C97A0E0|nr:OmpA family protein [Rhizobium leguminosarum]MBY5565292.1 OmpA family protein [Rhizobium leguminosarum]MBY5585219.1 OmpA family protein [Rhizobium leguminosarum]MBY5612101.1 OmpA family protein [Rhizobium leguminosarum]MBY5626249.1 OmpA family protein [Rhizobium leguminosarum]MBY5646337.1 OmpA family protein [Rhizobium leguminosarum]